MGWGTLEQWTIPMCQEEKHLGDSSAILFRGYSLAINLAGSNPICTWSPWRAAPHPWWLSPSSRWSRPSRTLRKKRDEFGCEWRWAKIAAAGIFAKGEFARKKHPAGPRKAKKIWKETKVLRKHPGTFSRLGLALLGHVFGVVQINCHQPFVDGNAWWHSFQYLNLPRNWCVYIYIHIYIHIYILYIYIYIYLFISMP